MTTATPSTLNTQPVTIPQPPAVAGPARYDLDATHSHVAFSVRHMMIANVRGEFQKVSGQVSYDPANPEATAISASIDVASINTRDEKRDAHLRSPDFFDVGRYPTIEFVSRRAARRRDGLDVVGDLTIAGTTREVTLAVEEITPERVDPYGNARIGATARTKIRRSDFGMRWNAALEAGGVLVGDEISIQLEVELLKRK
jgi:polyisoprenoid-binding protein YceI